MCGQKPVFLHRFRPMWWKKNHLLTSIPSFYHVFCNLATLFPVIIKQNSFLFSNSKRIYWLISPDTPACVECEYLQKWFQSSIFCWESWGETPHPPVCSVKVSGNIPKAKQQGSSSWPPWSATPHPVISWWGFFFLSCLFTFLRGGNSLKSILQTADEATLSGSCAREW